MHARSSKPQVAIVAGASSGIGSGISPGLLDRRLSSLDLKRRQSPATGEQLRQPDTATFPRSQINEAFERMCSGQARYRGVLVKEFE